MTNTDEKVKKNRKKTAAGAVEQKEKPKSNRVCNDKDCPIHGDLKARGRIFNGTVTRKFHKRVVIEFERMIYVRKYERYLKARTKIHARLPVCIEDNIQIGDYIKVQECRPLSKIIHFVVIEKLKDAVENDSAVGTRNKKIKSKKGKGKKKK